MENIFVAYLLEPKISLNIGETNTNALVYNMKTLCNVSDLEHDYQFLARTISHIMFQQNRI